jgi:hypothetical protein
MTAGSRVPRAAGGPLPLQPPHPPHLRRRVQGRKLLRVFSVARLSRAGQGMDRHADLQELRSTAHASGRADHSQVSEGNEQVLALTCSFTWWQVLGSNQRRLSRRFYRQITLTVGRTADLRIHGFGRPVPQRRSAQVPCPGTSVCTPVLVRDRTCPHLVDSRRSGHDTAWPRMSIRRGPDAAGWVLDPRSRPDRHPRRLTRTGCGN